MSFQLVVVEYKEKSDILLLKSTKSLVVIEYKEESQILQIKTISKRYR